MSFPNGIANMNMSLLPDVWYADRDTSTLTIWKVTEKISPLPGGAPPPPRSSTPSFPNRNKALSLQSVNLNT